MAFFYYEELPFGIFLGSYLLLAVLPRGRRAGLAIWVAVWLVEVLLVQFPPRTSLALSILCGTTMAGIVQALRMALPPRGRAALAGHIFLVAGVPAGFYGLVLYVR